MRDTHRMREKYDLSLDSRQVVSLLIGGIVVLGAVFVLGVLVGKKLAGTPRADHAPDLLTALDNKSDALERARAAPPLTFQEELTRPAASTPTVARLPPVSPPPTPASSTAPTVARVTAPAATPPTSATPAAAAAAPTASKPASPVRAAAVPVTTAAVTEAKQERKPEAEKKAEPAARPPPPESVATRSAPAAAHPAPKVPEATSATGAFTLQLGASPNRDDAERQAARLREKGYAPYIVTAEVPGKGTWYRVRMGSFPTKDSATRYLQDFKRETQAEAFVASTR
jgi:DedD protein